MRTSFTLRIRIILGIIILAALVLLVRLYSVQIVRGAEFAQSADRQYVRPSNSTFNRGSIYFRNKDGERISAATLKSGFILAIAPDNIVDKEATYEALNAIVPLDRDIFMQRASKVDDPYEELSKRVEARDAKALKALELPGVNLYRNQWRFYPGDTLAAQTVGFVSFTDDTLRGQYGLERYYDDKLKRESDSLYVNFFAEIFGGIGTLMDDEAEREGDIVISIEPTVQAFLEKKLTEMKDEWSSEELGGIIIDPMTGEIFALGVNPSFDLNGFSQVEDIGVYSNLLVENVYEMGSIIKPITMAIGLDSGAITQDDTYTDYGFVEMDTATIHNFDGKARGKVNIQEILNQSLNTGVVHVYQKVGREPFREYMKDFGLGDETGIDLPNEVAGLVSNLDSPRDIELATASFGQGIALTPMATVRALSALANGGRLISPHLVVEYTERLGPVGENSKEVVPFEGRQVISKESSEEITRMLITVVDEALRGGTVALPNYTVAAKTGTAQIAKEDEAGYYEDRFLHSFFGYFPAYEPRFLVFLFHVNPRGARYASETLTQPFIDTAEFLLNYYNVPPDRDGLPTEE